MLTSERFRTAKTQTEQKKIQVPVDEDAMR